MTTTKNIQNRRGGAIHNTIDGTPSCDPWQDARKYRATKDAVTCKRCLRNGYDDSPATDEH